ncbi:MAG: GNAT family acetyltransferase [Bacteroidota bacterium]
MFIRKYESKDENEVIQIWTDVFGYDAPHNDPRLALERKVAFNDGLLLVAEEDGQIIGMVMGGYDGHRGWIYSLAVRPGFRKSGTGTKLIQAILEEFKKRGCLKVNLQVLGTNREVVEFYRRNGFAVEDRISMGIKLY